PEKITSGAASDLKQATSLARHMVREWGMSERVGPRALDPPAAPAQPAPGPALADLADSEVRKLLSDSLDRAKHILRAHAL
ncbi:cell division protein FtsH, partial [Klebsiella pneumoniae]|nr:cell division protein FtsH [Klebsiella pneumoniae]